MADEGALEVYDDDGALDPAKFLSHLRESNRRSEALAAVRPTWGDLAEPLSSLRAVANHLLLDGDDDDQFRPRKLRAPKRGSRAWADSEALNRDSFNTRNALVIEMVGDYLVSTSDHLWAMCVLLRSDPPFRPLLATGRILLDAGAHVRYLLDPQASLRERVIRAANVELDAIREELKDITGDESDEGDEMRVRRRKILADGDADGLPRLLSKNGDPRDSFTPPLIQTADMANLVLSDGFGHRIWRLASSVVHAKDRSILKFVGGRGDVDLSGPGLGKSMSVPFVAPCVVVMTESYREVAEYLGHPSHKLETAIQRVFWTLQAMAGDHDDELLRRGGN